MRQRDFITYLFYLMGSLIFATCGVTQGDVLLQNGTRGLQAAPKPTNVVFFLVDDLGWRDIGAFGSPFYDTPHVDRLASQGMRFTEAYAACPVCSPTRASIMTGKYPHYGNQGGSPGAAVRAGDYKLIEFFEDGRLELYNLRQDIGETDDLAARMPDKVKALSDVLHQWLVRVEARMPTPYPG